MAKLSRAALGTAAGRDYARRGWEISQTGAKPAGGGAYERMGGLDGFYGMQDARRAGINPGDPSWFTNPFRGLPGVGENVSAGKQMSQMTGGGRSGLTGMSTFQPGGGSFATGAMAQNDNGEWEFDKEAYMRAHKAREDQVRGGATVATLDPNQFMRRKSKSGNVVPFRPGAAPEGALQRSWKDSLFRYKQ
jgi:hypothetical protein